MMNRIAELESKGFKRWQKNGMDRMYVNADMIGLDEDAATFNGKKISNSQVREMKTAKTYIDLNKNTICSDSVMLAAAVADMLDVDYSYGSKTIAI